MALPIIPTDRNGTTYIAFLFVFLAYVLHPMVEKTLGLLKAYRAWRRIKNGETIEVTEESIISDVMQRRWKCDAARWTAIILIVFSGASWGLELTLGLENVTDGPVDMMDRPPPVVYRDGTTGAWEARSDLEFSVDDKGFLGNFEGTLQTGSAKTRYRVGSEDHKGSTLSAWWSDNYAEAHSSLSYDVYGNGTAVLNNLNCTTQNGGNLYVGEEAEERWGTARECGNGPTAITNTDGLSSPTILLQDDATGVIHLVVEEESNYPGFMYSVWIPVDETTTATSTNVTIRHYFHVASKSRLAEAIVTGVVNGVETGGGCVDLLFQHSQLNEEYELDGKTRASPFGEHPGDTSAVSDLSDVEPIEEGVFMDDFASTCFVFVMIVWVLSTVFSACISRFVDVDVYNRDELIKAATLDQRGGGQSFIDRLGGECLTSCCTRSTSAGDKNAPPASEMRTFVHQDKSGELQVTVHTTEEEGRGHSTSSSAALIDASRGSSGGLPASVPKWVRLEGRLVEPPPGHLPATQTRPPLPLPTPSTSSYRAAFRQAPATDISVTRASAAQRQSIPQAMPRPLYPPETRRAGTASRKKRRKRKARTSAAGLEAGGRSGSGLQKATAQQHPRPTRTGKTRVTGAYHPEGVGVGRQMNAGLPTDKTLPTPAGQLAKNIHDKPNKVATGPRPVTRRHASAREPRVRSASTAVPVQITPVTAPLYGPAQGNGHVSVPGVAMSLSSGLVGVAFDDEAGLGATFGRPPNAIIEDK